MPTMKAIIQTFKVLYNSGIRDTCRKPAGAGRRVRGKSALPGEANNKAKA